MSDGLRRSQLFAQETAKKPQTSISRITFLLKHDKEENIWQKRPTRGKTEINRITGWEMRLLLLFNLREIGL